MLIQIDEKLLAAPLPRGVTLEHCTITTWAELTAKHDVVVQVAERSIQPAEPSAERRRRGVSALKLRRILGPLTVVVLPGYYATDGNAEVEYRAATSAKEAAREYVETGDWGERSETIWIDVLAYRKGFVLGENGDIVEIRIDEQRHTIALDPEEPPCTRDEHTWGERDMRGHGGGVIITDICMHCARYRIIDTWAQRRDTGEQGLESVEYRESDERSREWVEARRLEAVADDLSDDYDARFDREERRVVVAVGELDDDEAYDAANALEDRLGDDYFVSWSRDNDGNVRLYVSVA